MNSDEQAAFNIMHQRGVIHPVCHQGSQATAANLQVNLGGKSSIIKL